MNFQKNTSERACFHLNCKHATMLEMRCDIIDVFSRKSPKIYRTAISKNFFRCMQSKSQRSTHTVVFFGPLMLVITKGRTYLNKPTSLSLRYDPALKG